MSDLQFLEEMRKDPGSNWLCINCHAPLANQQERIAIDVSAAAINRARYVRNPDYDPLLGAEAITCAVCHVRDGVILGPWGDTAAPHPVRKSESLLSEQTCVACHQAVADYQGTLICQLETGDEWKAGPFAAAGVNCVDCHMPAVTRAIAEGGPPRRSGRHVWFGSGIHKELRPSDERRRLYESFRPALHLELSTDKPVYRPGETALVELLLGNAGAGHHLPTGDPERFITIDVEVWNAAGATLGRRNLRIGQQWQWFPEVKKLSDNRLKPQETRRQSFAFVLPTQPGLVRVRAAAVNHRLSEENAAYHGLLGRYPLSTPIGVAEARAVVR